jgi:5'-methylthioadenosine phosphorylase
MIPMGAIKYAVIGGSGLYHMPELTDINEHRIDTPFGAPSDAIITGTVRGQTVAFLPRHGRGHILTPSEVPYRANIWALKSLGVTHIVSVTACGSLREDYAPGHIVIPDQIYDNTRLDRGRSFFGGGLVAHASVADPFCPDVGEAIAQATGEAGGTVHRGGAFITIEGPRFSTKAESNAYRQLGFDIIGMTASPEAFLAREAEICYAAMAHVTDYDVWHDSGTVSASAVFETFSQNLRLAQVAVAGTIERLAKLDRACGCADALAGSFATAKDRVSPDVRHRLAPIIGKYFPL